MSKRDEKGLTLSGRALIRLVTEFVRVERAYNKLSTETSLSEIISQPTVAVRVGDLLILAREMAERIGSEEEIAAYLREHEAEDDAWFREQSEQKQTQTVEQQKHALLNEIEKALMNGPPCAACGKPTCVACDQCHHCAVQRRKEQAN